MGPNYEKIINAYGDAFSGTFHLISQKSLGIDILLKIYPIKIQAKYRSRSRRSIRQKVAKITQHRTFCKISTKNLNRFYKNPNKNLQILQNLQIHSQSSITIELAPQ